MTADEAPRRRPRERPRKGRGGATAFLLVSAVPAAALVWFFLQPETRRQAILHKIPEGAGGRAIQAGIAFGVLILLSAVALPAFHGATARLKESLGRMRQRRGFLRVLLFPVEIVVAFLLFLAQLLFAVDAFLIVASALAGLLLGVRIVRPGFLPDFLPQLGG